MITKRMHLERTHLPVQAALTLKRHSSHGRGGGIKPGQFWCSSSIVCNEHRPLKVSATGWRVTITPRPGAAILNPHSGANLGGASLFVILGGWRAV